MPEEKEHYGLKDSDIFYRRYNQVLIDDVFWKLQEFIDGVDDWFPTNRYSFYHHPVPLEIFMEDPHLKFIHDRFSEGPPWVLMMPAGTMFELHVDPSKSCALNIPMSERGAAITLFKHSRHERKYMDHMVSVDYGQVGQFTLFNGMKQHLVINYSDRPVYMFTIPMWLMKSDHHNITQEYDVLADLRGVQSERTGSSTTLSTERMTPMGLEIMMFNKVSQILEENGFDR